MPLGRDLLSRKIRMKLSLSTEFLGEYDLSL